jgi:tetratricopeptide (TPR) repeat protein
MVERAAFLQSTNPDYHLNYGSVLALLAKSMKKKGSENEAVINAYRKAVAEWEVASLLYDRGGSNNANYAKCLFQLADAYEFIFRQIDKAAILYKKVLQIQPGHSLSAKALKRLQKD